MVVRATVCLGLVLAVSEACVGCHVAVDGASTLDPRILESSGLVQSRRYPGVFWTHSDSSQAAVLYAVDGHGRLLRNYELRGEKNVDWEDIAIDDDGHLYLGDIGNNGSQRRDLAVLRFAEPDPRAEGAEIGGVQRIPFRYPDQDFVGEAVPNFDAESLFWANGELYLLTKHRSDQSTTLYRFPSLRGSQVRDLERISEFNLGGYWARFGGMATAADLRREGDVLVVLTYHALFFFDAPRDGHDYLARLRKRIDFDQRATGQCEAVAWDGDDVVFTNESGSIFRIVDPLGSDHVEFPAD
ncbi:MAG: hypothetical protein B7733_12475 [Myxococcales bacterium FL481]|nr:MAG: hypothetical protein B7733_12475 [Myxococcales bacterium FL481]